ncbi:MAG TPA: DUF6763 family protein [Steroidobacteraceae bacterium]
MVRERIAVGQWYLRRDTRDVFQVVDRDEETGTVRIQMFDGSLDEVDEDMWQALLPEAVAAPEDWTGPLDNLETDDPEQFGAQSEEQWEESWFRDDREPWESLLVEDAVAA